MVEYGSSIIRARRLGWEDVYFNYNFLKSTLEKIDSVKNETIHFKKKSLDELIKMDCNVRSLDRIFLDNLQKEIEKVSLFVLLRQGELADGVGALRFGKEMCYVRDLIERDINMPGFENEHESDFNDNDQVQNIFDEKSSFLPKISRFVKTSIDEEVSYLPKSLFVGKRIEKSLLDARPMFRSNRIFSSDNNSSENIDAYTSLAVEMLHLIRFTSVNTIGIQKIIKKHDKVLSSYMNARGPEFGFDWDMPLMKAPVEGLNSLVAKSEYHLENLANSKGLDAIKTSLILALAKYEKRDVVDGITADLESTQDNLEERLIGGNNFTPSISLIRLKCAMSSIHYLSKLSKLVNKPFEAFLSRKAMIATGDLENNNRQILEYMICFQPDAILSMEDFEILEWYDSILKPALTRISRTRTVTMTSVDVLDEKMLTWGSVDMISMIINLMSTLLYTVNYYIVSPTANHYAILLGKDGAFGATLVGVSSLTAIVAAFLYSFWYTRSTFQSALLFSAICPCIGNILYSLAISYRSMKIALLGRVLVGFGSAEVVNRQLISASVDFKYMTKVSALFVAAGAIGMSLGPLLAGILDMVAGRDTEIDIHLNLPGMSKEEGIIYDHVTSPGFVMAILWFAEILALVFLFREPKRINVENSTGATDLDSGKKQTIYGTEVMYSSQNDFVENQMKVIYNLIFSNVALPVTLFLFAFIELTDEVLISSCSMVCRRYFGWNGSRAGFLMASLGALVIPSHFLVEQASRLWNERRIMKYSIVIILVGLIAILNFEGLWYDIMTVTTEDSESSFTSFMKYDWGIGNFVYIFMLSLIFMGTIVLEGVNTSLMNKVTPSKLNETFINCGLLATLVGTIGRVFGDSIITFSALYDKRIFVDFINAVFFPVIPLALLGFFFIQRYYTFLS